MSPIQLISMNTLPESFFTSIPYQDAGMVLTLRNSYQKKIIDNSTRIIEYIEKDYGVELSDFINFLNKIDTSKKLSSKIHNFTVVLESSYANNNIDSIINILESLTELKDDSIYGTSLAIDTFFSENFDQKVVEILGDQPGVRAIYGQDPEVFALSKDELDYYGIYSKQALKKISILDENFYNEITSYINTIRLFKGKIVTGISSILTFGTLYLRVPNAEVNAVPYFIDHFTHETSHHHLHALMGFDPLVLNPPSETFTAPIRKDLRPMYGIYHATFVLSRICRLLKRLNEFEDGTYNEHLVKVRDQFVRGLETVSKHGNLTDLGRRVLFTCEETSEINVHQS